jgi:hypothetical protein
MALLLKIKRSNFSDRRLLCGLFTQQIDWLLAGLRSWAAMWEIG